MATSMTNEEFRRDILAGIPEELPQPKERDLSVSHAPRRKDILTEAEEELALRNALGVSQYGQMTAGSYMYIGPQGIVHGTTITVMNAARKQLKARGLKPSRENMGGMLFVSAGLGGMSGAQPKAGVISGVVSVIAEINPLAARKRHDQGWVDEIHEDLDVLIPRIRQAFNACTINSAYAMGVEDCLGSISVGKLGSVIITEKLPSLAFIPYSHQTPFIRRVIFPSR